MACIDGAIAEPLHDKRDAMLSYNSIICSSRIQLVDDAKSIFFDTVSKFGILHFVEVIDASTARVTRADLPNQPPGENYESDKEQRCMLEIVTR